MILNEYENLIHREKKILTEYATRSDNKFLTTRQVIEGSNDYYELRLPYQRDRDRIVHSRGFRRLMHKTQVFNANKGDHFRNRLTHTLEVNQIARSIGKVLGLNDELIEAIALGHDLGHTPFGHVGERTLHLIISGQMFKDDSEIQIPNCGGFKHNYQSVHLCDNIEKSNENQNGLNLTLAVREGIIKHTSKKIRIVNDKQKVYYPESLDLSNINMDLPSFTLEGQVVAIADEIAQSTHDMEDGMRAKIMKLKDISDLNLVDVIRKQFNINFDDLKETVDVRNVLIKHLIGYLINDVCKASIKNIGDYHNKNNEYPMFKNSDDVFKEELITFSKNTKEYHTDLLGRLRQIVITSQEVSQADAKAEYIINKLFKAYYVHPQQLPDYILNRYFNKKGKVLNRAQIESDISDMKKDSGFIRMICDHIGCMTDQHISREYKKLYEPEYF